MKRDLDTACGKHPLSGALDPDMVDWAYKTDLMGYTGNYDRDGNVESLASALLYLAVGEYQEPRSDMIHERILASVRNLIAGGREPGFNAGPNHSYAPLALALAVIRHTPTLWAALGEDERARLDLIMECFAIATAFVTHDDNYYRTGVALTGNFYKTWNANHRLAMTVPIVGSALYFSADGADGAARVNAVFHDFSYDRFIEKFDRYGFLRAKYHWTAGGFTHADGTHIPGSRELLTKGGEAHVAFADNHDTDLTTRSPREALAVSITDRGGLFVRFADGREEELTAGEVSLSLTPNL